MYIYRIINNINGKSYIGQSLSTPDKTKNYYGSGVKILLAIKSIGKENFTKEILKDNVNSIKLLNVLEKLFISKFDSTNDLFGYNILPGSSLGLLSYNPTSLPEVRDRMKRTHMINGKNKGEGNHMYGKKLTKKEIAIQKVKRIISVNKKLRDNPNHFKDFFTEEVRQKMSKAGSGINNSNFGKRWSEEHKANLSKKLIEYHKNKNI